MTASMHLSTVRRTISTSKALFVQAIRRDLQFRSQAWIGIVVGLGELAAGLVPVLVITSFYPPSSPVAGLVVPTAGFFALACGLMDTFITPGLRRFDTAVRKGDLDSSLLRPVPTALYAIFRWMRPAELAKAVAGIALLVAWALTSKVAPTGSELLLGGLIALAGAMAYSAAWAAMAFLALWLKSIEPVNDLAAVWRNAGQYPLGVFTQGVTVVLQTAIPVLGLAALPATKVLNLQTTGATLAISVTWILAATAVWRAGIRHYEGAST
ncbi:MAG: ABC-2 family transporter protein [Dermabacter sp.]|nr:ABC-2 family transporter protein [Dermabacter sp.]